MKTFFAKYKLIIGIVVVILAAGGIYWYVSSSTAPTFGAATVSKGNVVESVDEAANVVAENSAPISFQQAGQIARVNVQEGDMVGAGAVLATLDASSLDAAVQQAQAALAVQQAKLDSLMSGTRPEQLQINQSAVTTANQNLSIAVANAYSASDDAVRNQLDNLFSNIQTNNPTFLVQSQNSQTINDIVTARVILTATLADWYKALGNAGANAASLSGTADADLQQIKSYIDTIALVVNDAMPSSALPAATLAQYKTDIATARTEIQASISAVSGDESALTAAQNNLTLAQAGATAQDLEAQQAAVAQAQAAVASAQVALDHAAIVAPFSGTVQNLTAQVGQVVSPGTPMLTLVNNGGLKIITYVSEADVAKIKTSDTADVTLDAFGPGTTFPATVTTIDAAQTQVNGSAAYQVTLHFKDANDQIKDGMTGNVHIIVAEDDNVVEVPSNLVINDNNNYFVLTQNGGAVEKTPVQIGIVGNDGMTEITSGLNVGDRINNF